MRKAVAGYKLSRKLGSVTPRMKGKSWALVYIMLVLATSEGQSSAVWLQQLQVLREVMAGPTRGKSLALHLDPGIPETDQQEIMFLPEVRETCHLTLTLGHNHSWWLLADPVLHVVLLFSHRTQLLNSLYDQWKPRNLLLIHLIPTQDVSILKEDVLNNVEKLALITANVQGRPIVYTVLPFLSSTPYLLGHWDPHHYTRWDNLFVHRFTNFHNYNFILPMWPDDDPPFIYRDAQTDKPVGTSVKILEALSTPLNFSYTITEDPTDRQLGSFVNGSWVGLLGMVHKREKNFSLNGLFLTWERQRDLDASVVFCDGGYGVFLQTPQPLPQWTNIQRPFSNLVWAAVFVCLTAATILVLLQVKSKCFHIFLLKFISDLFMYLFVIVMNYS